MTWIDVAIIVLLTLLAAYCSIAVLLLCTAKRYENEWRAKFNEKGADRG